MSKRRASARQVAASIANSQKSTGPKTRAGKSRVRGNALRHGLLSQRLVGNIKDTRSYLDLLRGYQSHFNPEGFLEDTLVERMAFASWKLAQIAGHIGRCLGISSIGVELSIPPLLLIAQARALGSGFDVEAVKSIHSSLRNALEELRATNDISSATMEGINALPDVGRWFGWNLLSYLTSARKSDLFGFGGPNYREVAAEVLSRAVDDYAEILAKMVAIEVNRETASEVEPNLTSLDLLNRYETACAKQFYRALTELQLAQDKRKGGEGGHRITID